MINVPCSLHLANFCFSFKCYTNNSLTLHTHKIRTTMSIVSSLCSSNCPHQQKYIFLDCRTVSIQTCQEHSATCSECRLLLQTVEAFKPGWINSHRDDDGMLVISRSWVYTVHLALKRELKTNLAPLESDRHFREMRSFQVFRRSQGRMLLRHKFSIFVLVF